jgi:hypothetical protein
MNEKKIYRVMDYSFCPITQKVCLENQCAWWIVVMGKGGCALRSLGALVHIGIFCERYKEVEKTAINTIYDETVNQG